LKSDIISVLP